MAPSLSGCIKCNHKDIWKYGFYFYRNKKVQVYRCKKCKTTFTELSTSKYVRHRYHKRTILLSVMLYRYGVSSYAVSEILRKRFRVKVSPWTICKWARKFGDIKELHKHLGIKFTNIWHMDEMFIKAQGRMNYLFAVIDSSNNVIALYISKYRSQRAAIQCLRKARCIAGKPTIIVTDEWLAYPRAIRKVFGRKKPKVRHVKAHFEKKLVYHNDKWYSLSNNRIEGWNSWFRRIYRGFRGFKSIISMQHFLDTFTLLYNLRDRAWEFLAEFVEKR